MDVQAKYVLYTMFYKLAMHTLIFRGQTKLVTPWHLHYEAMRGANYCLAALGEEITLDDIWQAQTSEIDVSQV